jgi:hypothetical protein
MMDKRDNPETIKLKCVNEKDNGNKCKRKHRKSKKAEKL